MWNGFKLPFKFKKGYVVSPATIKYFSYISHVRSIQTATEAIGVLLHLGENCSLQMCLDEIAWLRLCSAVIPQ